MMLKTTVLKSMIGAAILLATAACDPVNTAGPSKPQAIGMANPASVHCRSEGGRLDIRRNAEGGEYGVCVFDDGRQCEEWALFRDKRCVAPPSTPMTDRNS